jgi:uncharacterized DUF497 family protein
MDAKTARSVYGEGSFGGAYRAAEDVMQEIFMAREIIIGASALQRMIHVCFVERIEDLVRIISARPATREEIKDDE